MDANNQNMTAEDSAKKSGWNRIETGEPPKDDNLLDAVSVGIESLADFWQEKYLDEFIADGGSKIKFVTGKRGSGKSHFLEVMEKRAREDHYTTVCFSAKDVWLHDFKEIYLEVLKQSDIMSVLQKCAEKIISEMGYDPAEVGKERTFIDYLAAQGEADALTKREIRLQLKKMFLDNTRMDNNFAYSCSLLCGGILGHPLLEAQNREFLLKWLYCSKEVKLIQLRNLGLSPSRINKYNARHMLRSLSELMRAGGGKGLLICIDDLEILMKRSSMEAIHYTKMRREDTYESIRQLIDEIDSMKSVMFLFGFDRIMMDDENYGLKSYQALWMRIQNEVASEKFNKFADIVDFDRYGREVYSTEVLREMADKLVQTSLTRGETVAIPDEEEIAQIKEASEFSNIGLPLLVNRAVFGEKREENTEYV